MKYVVGHKGPDTDSVCSVVAWAWYLNKVKGIKVTPIIQGKPNNESEFVLKFWNVKTPSILTKVSEGDEIYLMDTTNPDEMINGYDKVNINMIIDHHKLGGLSTVMPLDVTVRAYGCSATVLYEYMINENYDINLLPKEVAGLMISSIISDTLFLRSPTTTKLDREALQILSKVATMSDLSMYANKLFDAKADLDDITDMELISYDAKKFDIGGKKVLVSVIETVKPKDIFLRVKNIRKEMQNSVSSGEYEYIAFFIIDIINRNAYYIVQGNIIDKWVANGYNVEVEGQDYVLLPGIVSRKKQIIPVLEKVSK